MTILLNGCMELGASHLIGNVCCGIIYMLTLGLWVYISLQLVLFHGVAMPCRKSSVIYP